MLLTSPGSYPCDECGECFSSPSLLGEHTALHDKTQPRFTQKRYEKENNKNPLLQLPDPGMYHSLATITRS